MVVTILVATGEGRDVPDGGSIELHYVRVSGLPYYLDRWRALRLFDAWVILFAQLDMVMIASWALAG